MNNHDIAQQLERTAILLELAGEDPFRAKAYRQAAEVLDAFDKSVVDLTDSQELDKIPGIGKSIASNIRELIQSGTFPVLRKLEADVPEGVFALTQLRGLGPKRVRMLWKEYRIDSPDALERIINDGSILKIKGFGKKTVNDLYDSLKIWRESKGHMLLHHAFQLFDRLVYTLKQIPEFSEVEFNSNLFDGSPEVDRIELIAYVTDPSAHRLSEDLIASGWNLIRNSESGLVWEKPDAPITVQLRIDSKAGDNNVSLRFSNSEKSNLIDLASLRGILHVHSNWSDGMDDLRSLAVACRDLGYEYLGITDHSRSATYAGGLTVEQVWAQWEEIDRINAELKPFTLLKGIESDILPDGALDYPDEILEKFDFVIASIHSGFNMTESQATERIIRAVEHPATSILGHPTGRLLLKRKGYAIDHRAVIDACATNGTAIELNCNPYRMDLDWTWIEYAQQAGVMISINPDAHRIAEFSYLREGVLVARRGHLLRTNTLNAKSTPELLNWFRSEPKS